MEAIKDLGLNIFGSVNWLQSPLKDCYRGVITPDKVLSVYRRSKIVTNIHYDKSGSDSEGINLRPFETMASGAMLISDDSRAEMSRLFKDREEFISFPTGNYEEFKRLVKYYLDHSEERMRIAKNGYDAVMGKHTYLVRMREMMDIVQKYSSGLPR